MTTVHLYQVDHLHDPFNCSQESGLNSSNSPGYISKSVNLSGSTSCTAMLHANGRDNQIPPAWFLSSYAELTTFQTNVWLKHLPCCLAVLSWLNLVRGQWGWRGTRNTGTQTVRKHTLVFTANTHALHLHTRWDTQRNGVHPSSWCHTFRLPPDPFYWTTENQIILVKWIWEVMKQSEHRPWLV